MKKIIAALAITAVFASCKKEKITAPGTEPVAGKKISQTTYLDNASTSTEGFTYDANGRMLTITTSDRMSSFVYESDTRLMITTRKKSENSITRTIECTLNAKGAITQMLYKDPAGNLVYTYQYAYNADNQIINVKGAAPSGNHFESKAQVVNGVIKSSQTYQDGILSETKEYFYDNTKPNRLPSQLTATWPSHILFGKANPYLLSQTKTTSAAGVVTGQTNATYELDNDGDVTKITTFYPLDGTTSIITYQYQ